MKTKPAAKCQKAMHGVFISDGYSIAEFMPGCSVNEAIEWRF